MRSGRDGQGIGLRRREQCIGGGVLLLKAAPRGHPDEAVVEYS